MAREEKLAPRCPTCGRTVGKALTAYESLGDGKMTPVAYCSVNCLLTRLVKLSNEARQLTQLVAENS